jgi:hypothetical protein
LGNLGCGWFVQGQGWCRQQQREHVRIFDDFESSLVRDRWFGRGTIGGKGSTSWDDLLEEEEHDEQGSGGGGGEKGAVEDRR